MFGEWGVVKVLGVGLLARAAWGATSRCWSRFQDSSTQQLSAEHEPFVHETVLCKQEKSTGFMMAAQKREPETTPMPPPPSFS